MSEKKVITIDGPAASGKSSTAQMVAERLGFLHVDSGSLYRAATAAALRVVPDPAEWTEEVVLGAARAISLLPARSSFYPVMGGRSVEEEIRGDRVTANVSAVAKMPRVRDWVNETVRNTSADHNVVVDGRDIGTVVFPKARLKIFLVADAEVRAKRRLIQKAGEVTDARLAEETRALLERDERDASQTVPAADAVVVDSTILTQAEQVAKIVALAEDRA
ncbi:MAG: (d)CMP kinase [Gemmatimonadaceae bacterium]|nr:(d)CMP kinase [Gemmatimonadaceae bacterium]